jgi:hypothetical protein
MCRVNVGRVQNWEETRSGDFALEVDTSRRDNHEDAFAPTLQFWQPQIERCKLRIGSFGKIRSLSCLTQLRPEYGCFCNEASIDHFTAQR